MRSRSRSRYRGASSHGNASITCCAVHAALGCSVMLKWMTRRRSWTRITRTNSTRNVTVGTVKKSRATRSCTWFFRRVFHVDDGGFRGRTRYRSTVDYRRSEGTLVQDEDVRRTSQECECLRVFGMDSSRLPYMFRVRPVRSKPSSDGRTSGEESCGLFDNLVSA